MTTTQLFLRKLGDSLLEVLLPNTGEYDNRKAEFGGRIHCFTSASDLDPFISTDSVDSRMGAQIDIDTAVADPAYADLCRDLLSPVLFDRILTLWAEHLIPDNRELKVDVDHAVTNTIADKVDALPAAFTRC